MFCPKCGSYCTDGAVFCSQCSSRLNNSQRVQEQSRKSPGDSPALSSMICGILGVLNFLPIILSIIAIVQGNKAKKLGNESGMATAGVILGWVGLVIGILTVLLIIFYIFLFASGLLVLEDFA